MNQVDYFEIHSPRCIAAFKATSTRLPEHQFDGHPSLSDLKLASPGVTVIAPEHINTVFQLACACGSERHHLLGYPQPDSDALRGPFSLRCADCARETPLFDQGVDGFDAECDNNSTALRDTGAGTPIAQGCQDCGNPPYEVFVRFEYTDDLFSGHYAEYMGRQHNLFTWFSAVGTCPGCARLMELADCECA